MRYDFDDKDVAIIALCIIAVISLVFLQSEAKEIVVAIVSAIAGFVTGRKGGISSA